MSTVKKKRRKYLIILACLLILVAYIFLNNGPFFVKERTSKPFLFANGGLAQAYHTEGLTNQTCTASHIFPPKHPYLENTIASIKAAFQLGADIVEFDIQRTRDGQFVVFHEGTLDCRTNGKGAVSNYTLAELKKLDIGYGYTADGGKTFPFRGKGIGLIPSLDEVLNAFPDQLLYIDVKSNDPQEGLQLARVLTTLPANRQNLLTVGGGDKPSAPPSDQGDIKSNHPELPAPVRCPGMERLCSNCLPAYRAAYSRPDCPLALGMAQSLS